MREVDTGRGTIVGLGLSRPPLNYLELWEYVVVVVVVVELILYYDTSGIGLNFVGRGFGIKA